MKIINCSNESIARKSQWQFLTRKEMLHKKISKSKMEFCNAAANSVNIWHSSLRSPLLTAGSLSCQHCPKCTQLICLGNLCKQQTSFPRLALERTAQFSPCDLSKANNNGLCIHQVRIDLSNFQLPRNREAACASYCVSVPKGSLLFSGLTCNWKPVCHTFSKHY